MGSPEETLNVKLVQLKLNVDRTQQILNSDNGDAIERQQRVLKGVTSDIERLKSEVEARKIANKGIR